MPPDDQPLVRLDCLDFPGRSAVSLREMADKLGVSCDLLERLVDDGTLVALDLARRTGTRRLLRVPLDEYRRFAILRLTGSARSEFLAQLPPEALRALAAEIAALLAA